MWVDRKMKNPSIKTLRRKLKKIFSEYIRKRDCLRHGGRCVTCGKIIKWNDSQANAGHFVSVGSATQGTEYDARNVHLQCVYCNNWGEGKKPEYAIYMVKTYGEGIIEELVKQSKWTLVKFAETLMDIDFSTPKLAYEALIDYYTEKLKGL